jgi:amino acid transporter
MWVWRTMPGAVPTLDVMGTAAPPHAPPRRLAKRMLVGRAKSSGQLEHTLLPKIIALPVFSSDPLSSNAYATEEILLVLLTASTAIALVMPISIAIAILLAIVVTSYRQTVRAYPSGGGAYIVSKENLGTIPGLVAAAALMTDYVLTVSVSVSAGVLAISSAFPAVADHAVAVTIGFIVLLTLANLRGVKEAGSIFAFPTYAFVASVFVMVGVGLLRCVGGCPPAGGIEPAHGLATTAAPLSLFVVLHAFSSGSTALTGVEAISNGVPAFRRPQAANAARTLAVMGVMAAAMFLGISWLATHIPGITVSHERSVIAQVAHTVFGGGIGFYVVQAFTAAILILAANTAYQDFPRLSSILARDGFMPSQFKNRGDRLVFSNGVLVLAFLACVLVLVFDADVSRLIQLYVVGVFTSFTLSQAGMVRHWRKERADGERAARRAIVINAVGAVTTGVVLVVITTTKFLHGAWIVIAAMPFLVLGMLAIHRHYAHISAALRSRHLKVRRDARHLFVLLVPDTGTATHEALAQARGLSGELVGVYMGPDAGAARAATWWRSVAPRAGPLERLPQTGNGRWGRLRTWLADLERDDRTFVTVVVPEQVAGTSVWQLLTRQHRALLLKVRLLFTPDVAVMDVPLVPAEVATATDHEGVERDVVRNVVLVPVPEIHDGVVRALTYARALGAIHTEAVYFAADPDAVPTLADEWWEVGGDIPLSFIEAPFRDLGPPLLQEIRRYTDDPDTLVTVVIPEILVTRWWEHLLHGQTALFLKRLLLGEPRTNVVSLPYRLPQNGQTAPLNVSHAVGSPEV